MRKMTLLLLVVLLTSCVVESPLVSDRGRVPTPEIHFTLVVNDEEYHCRGWQVCDNDQVSLTVRMVGCLGYPHHELEITNVSSLTVKKYQE